MCTQWAIDYHRRSPVAASDDASASDVLRDIEITLSGAGIRDNDYLFYLQPTSPLRTISTARDSWEKLLQFSHQGFVSVTEIDAKFRKTLFLQGNTVRAHGSREALTSNQQSLSPLYLANGNLFAFRWGLFLETGTFPIEGLRPIIESDDVTLDIDTESDFERYLQQVR
jgi:CMP-N-acetylneuraminic acid synthetase